MDKTGLRKLAKQMRDDIPEDRRGFDAARLHDNITAFLQSRNVQGILATYHPIGSEIHPPHHMQGYHLALPVIHDKASMSFYPWQAGTHIVKGAFNIPVPVTQGLDPVIPDCILLPLLLCDTDGNRIGYGAGHYDRYLSRLSHKPLLIGVCFEEQVYDGVLPAEPHDIKLDVIITPERVIEI